MSAFFDAQPGDAHARLREILSAPVVPQALMIQMDFLDEPVRLCTRTVGFTDVQTGAYWRSGAGLLVGLPDLNREEGELAPERSYRLGLPEAWIDPQYTDWKAQTVEIAMNVAAYRNRDVNLLGQLFDPDTGEPVGWPFFYDSASMDRITLSFQPAGVILRLEAEGPLSRKGVPVYGMQTYQDQKRRYPNDEGFEFTPEFNRLIQWTDWS